jgi:SAM-dependent methyltransferase
MLERGSTVLSPYGPSRASRLLTELVPRGARVLDIGCATGYVAEELRLRRRCTVVGFEADSSAAAVARSRCDRLLVGDVESAYDRSQLREQFDVVLFGDVLEHLRQPSEVLADVRSRLTQDGVVIASIPNVAVWRARIPLMLGRFEYGDSGIFDRTHLRFFTRQTALRLACDAGYRVCSEHFVGADLPFPVKLSRVLPQACLDRVRQWLANSRPSLFAHQFVLVMTPAAQ